MSVINSLSFFYWILKNRSFDSKLTNGLDADDDDDEISIDHINGEWMNEWTFDIGSSEEEKKLPKKKSQWKIESIIRSNKEEKNKKILSNFQYQVNW